MWSPFKPLASISERLLTWKTVFLVAVTLACRASEFSVLWVDPPFLQFHSNKVTLYPDLSFLPKVVSDFNLRQPIVLPTFFPLPTSDLECSLHSLDVCRAHIMFHSLLLFGSLRSCSSAGMVILEVPWSLLRQSLNWIVSRIRLVYELAQAPLPHTVRAHSARAVATSTEFLRGAELTDICKAVTWATPSTFASHFWLDVHAKVDASLVVLF